VFALIGLSIREFARRDGCSDTLVRRAIRQGKLKPLLYHSLSTCLLCTDWREANCVQSKDEGANTDSANTLRGVRTVGVRTQARDEADVQPDSDDLLVLTVRPTSRCSAAR
jgi:hypothetical protein